MILTTHSAEPVTLTLVVRADTVKVVFKEWVATATWPPDDHMRRFRRRRNESHTNFIGRIVRYIANET